MMKGLFNTRNKPAASDSSGSNSSQQSTSTRKPAQEEAQAAAAIRSNENTVQTGQVDATVNLKVKFPETPSQGESKQETEKDLANVVATTTSASQDSQHSPPAHPSLLIVSPHLPPALARDNWSIDEFQFLKTVYKGKITQVFHAIDKKTGVSMAIKSYNRYNLSMVERYQVAREMKLHTALNHTGVIKMLAAWKDDAHVYMALEWAAGGDLSKFIQKSGGSLSESVAVEMVVEPLLSIINHIHGQGIIHRDLKPENVLMTSSLQLKLADFQMSIDSFEEIPNSRLGTIAYIAPEIFMCPAKKSPTDFKENPNIGYTAKVDVWSVGIMVYEMLVGNTPFFIPNATTEELIHNILRTDVFYPKYLSSGALSFLKMALQKHPKKRATIVELIQHPWLRAAAEKRHQVNGFNATRLPKVGNLRRSNTAA